MQNTVVKIAALLIMVMVGLIFAQPQPVSYEYYDKLATKKSDEADNYLEYRQKFIKLGLKTYPNKIGPDKYFFSTPVDSQYDENGNKEYLRNATLYKYKYIDDYYHLGINLDKLDEYKKLGLSINPDSMLNNPIVSSQLIVIATIKKVEKIKTVYFKAEIEINEWLKGKHYYKKLPTTLTLPCELINYWGFIGLDDKGVGADWKNSDYFIYPGAKFCLFLKMFDNDTPQTLGVIGGETFQRNKYTPKSKLPRIMEIAAKLEELNQSGIFNQARSGAVNEK